MIKKKKVNNKVDLVLGMLRTMWTREWRRNTL